MPIYEYECTKCGNIEEILQKFSDKPRRKCNKCSGKLHKLISQSAFHLKGTGWYVTDYKSKSGGYDGKTGSGDSAVDKDAKSGSSDASPSKPEAKKSTKKADE